MMARVDHIVGKTFHGRQGTIQNAFTYGIDYVMLDAEATPPTLQAPMLFQRNRFGLAAVWDQDHGGPMGKGQGPIWARQVLAAYGLENVTNGRLMILTQPRTFGHVFNPVSFWIAHDLQNQIRAVIAEVTNTFGDRHSYLCVHPDQRPIMRDDILTATKIFHVSPFQSVDGGYRFRFDIRTNRIGIWINYTAHGEGVFATLTGRRRMLTNWRILTAALARPLGARRVLALIHWQAFKLWWKGARYRPRPTPPPHEVSQ